MRTFLSILLLTLTIAASAMTSVSANDYSDYPAWASEAFDDAQDRGDSD